MVVKLFSFLAGVATGILLSRSASSGRPPAGQVSNGAQNSAHDGLASARGEREWEAHVPPRTDAEIRERIRSQMARTLSQPEAIQVEVSGGCVTLRGQVQARDSILLLAEVQSTAGVTDVRNELELQGSLEDVLPAHGQPARRAAEQATSHMS
jgi:osmotically-inducible protein OsmY